jgi:excisionase family DNA binding protein
VPLSDRYVTIAQAAVALRCSHQNLRQRIVRGTVRAERVGKLWLIARREVDRLTVIQPTADRPTASRPTAGGRAAT